MSNSVDINRYFSEDVGWIADVRIYLNNHFVYHSQASTKWYKTETAAVKSLISRLESLFPIIPNLEKRIEEKYKELMEMDWDSNQNADQEDMQQVLTFTQAQADQMTHLSCGFHSEKNYKLRVTRANTETVGLPQYDLKHRIQNLDINSRAFKFFNKNTCCICLETFKEVLDDERHLVVTSCNHVICCACLDSILKQKDIPLCPMCKSELDPFVIDLVFLDIDLTVNEEYTGKIFVDHTGNSDSE